MRADGRAIATPSMISRYQRNQRKFGSKANMLESGGSFPRSERRARLTSHQNHQRHQGRQTQHQGNDDANRAVANRFVEALAGEQQCQEEPRHREEQG